jgi:integrase/recombinase XerD
MAAMSIYSVQKTTGGLSTSFRVCDAGGGSVASCDQFLTELSQRDCSVYTQRAYAIGLAHFFNWLHCSGFDPDQVTRQVVGNYILEFARGSRQGAVISRSAPKPRQARTINHRISVLASYFDYRIRCDTDDGQGAWNGRINPASGNPIAEEPRHGMVGRDLPSRKQQRDGFRRRTPHTLPKRLEPVEVEKLIDTAASWRDKAILTLLSRTGSACRRLESRSLAGMAFWACHWKISTASGTSITVRLKGARDQHRVPVTDDFWPLLDRVSKHRTPHADGGSLRLDRFARKGRGKPLCYASFESSLRYIARKAGVSVHPHLFRHTLAQGVLDATGNIKVAQEILGHSHLTTTTDIYMKR